jgi:hypothetical protein
VVNLSSTAHASASVRSRNPDQRLEPVLYRPQPVLMARELQRRLPPVLMGAGAVIPVD